MKTDSFPEVDAGHAFEEAWPELALRLDRFLATKGVERWLRADVIQETATRLYPRWETLDHSLPLWNLTATIAVRLVQNHRRKESRIDLVPDPDSLYKDDVELRGLQRAQLNKTRAALQQLNIDQRRVLLAEVGEAVLPSGTRNRINVLRLRARANLREALGPWAPSAITMRLRYLRARVAQKTSTLEMPTPATASSLVNVAMAATLGVVGGAATLVDAGAAHAGRAPLRSLAKLPAVHLDPIARIRQPDPRDLSGAEDRANKKYDQTSELVGNTRTTAEGLGEWADGRQEEARNLAGDGRNLGEDGANLAEDGRNLGEDGANLAEDGRDVAVDFSQQQEEWADRRKREVEDHLP